jgi:hypothetical protein
VNVVASISADGSIEGVLQPLNKRPLIAHLPINSASVIFNDEPAKYDPRPPANPEPYNSYNNDDPFTDNVEMYEKMESSVELNDDINKAAEKFKGMLGPDPYKDLYIPDYIKGAELSSDKNIPERNAKDSAASNKKEKKESVAITGPPVNPYHVDIPLFAEYAKDNKIIPNKVDTACFWCCHQFDWRPVVIPCRYINPSDQAAAGIYKAYGNFCTPECAMAYLLNEHIDMNSRWERISWLHHIYCTESMPRIYPAPGRETLRVFGGPYEIDIFRNLCLSRKLRVDINYPPMVSLLATMDTKPIDFYEQGERNISEYNNSLRLRRTKPLKELENTLDACLNITVGSQI